MPDPVVMRLHPGGVASAAIKMPGEAACGFVEEVAAAISQGETLDLAEA
jgi:hypothetical protein